MLDITDIAEIRKANLDHLVQRRFGGSKAKLAAATKIAQSQIGQWYTAPESPHHRTFSERSARRIEAELGLRFGYLDTLPDDLVAKNESELRKWPFTKIDPSAIADLLPDELARLEAMVQLMIDQVEAGRRANW